MKADPLLELVTQKRLEQIVTNVNEAILEYDVDLANSPGQNLFPQFRDESSIRDAETVYLIKADIGSIDDSVDTVLLNLFVQGFSFIGCDDELKHLIGVDLARVPVLYSDQRDRPTIRPSRFADPVNASIQNLSQVIVPGKQVGSFLHFLDVGRQEGKSVFDVAVPSPQKFEEKAVVVGELAQ